MPTPGPIKTQRKTKQDLALLANQGIQGKNISIISQNTMLQNQATAMRKLKRFETEAAQLQDDIEKSGMTVNSYEVAPQHQGMRTLAML